MKCKRCDADIREGEEECRYGQILCEDCYMDALSPPRSCDPWAVYTAKSFSNGEGYASELSETQTRILGILRETGGVEPPVLASRLHIRPTDLEREIAALRHMEKLRAEMRNGKKMLVPWH